MPNDRIWPNYLYSYGKDNNNNNNVKLNVILHSNSMLVFLLRTSKPKKHTHTCTCSVHKWGVTTTITIKHYRYCVHTAINTFRGQQHHHHPRRRRRRMTVKVKWFGRNWLGQKTERKERKNPRNLEETQGHYNLTCWLCEVRFFVNNSINGSLSAISFLWFSQALITLYSISQNNSWQQMEIIIK